MSAFSSIIDPDTNTKVGLHDPLGKSILRKYNSISNSNGVDFEEQGTENLYKEIEEKYGWIIESHNELCNKEPSETDEYEFNRIKMAYNETLKNGIIDIINNDMNVDYLKDRSIVIEEDGSSKFVSIKDQVKRWYQDYPDSIDNNNVEDHVDWIPLHNIVQRYPKNEALKILLSYPDHCHIAKCINYELFSYDHETRDDDFEIWYWARDIFTQPYIETMESMLIPKIKAVSPMVKIK